MVTDAAWTDYDADGRPDLLVVGEWMPVTFFRNGINGLVKADVTFTFPSSLSEAQGLSEGGSLLPYSSGWWNRIAPADLDGDGDTDYVLANFGWNAQFKASVSEPVSLYAKDFDSNGSIDPILAYYVNGVNYPAFSKDDLQQQISRLKGRFLKYEDYARVSMDDLFTEAEMENADVFRAYTLASSCLENLGNGAFELKPLPIIAQFAPMFGIAVEDFNGDGYPDILLGGNFTATRVKFGSYDAGKGALLLNDGSGRFAAADNAKTGLLITGEVRDMTVLPVADGQSLLVIAKNNGSVQVERLLKGPPQ